MAILYLDIFSGISGDMFLGALIDLGVPLARIETELQKLDVHDYHLHARRDSRSGIEGVKFDVHESHHGHGHDPDVQDPQHGHEHEHGHGDGHAHAHPASHAEAREQAVAHDTAESAGHIHGRTYADIRHVIAGSDLDPWIQARAQAVFRRIAEAEGKIHGQPTDSVHFHEVGAVDSIVDVVGACVALDALGRPRVWAGTPVEGRGFVRCAHGRMPLPAPATLEILAARGVAIAQCEEPHELITPTGAALLAEFVEQFGPLTGLVPARIGYGVGTRENHTRPNVLRAVLGSPADTPAGNDSVPHDWETDTVAVLETNLDDLNPEILGHLIDRALAEGALDVFHTPVQMKKSRPGVLLTVLAPHALADRLAAWILTESSAFGVRQTLATRRKLRREHREVETSFGKIPMKLGYLDGRCVQAAPEYEACRALAAKAGVPLKIIYDAATRATRPVG